jgi:glycosyltransferase involved in cell wall biosynthesis
MDLSGLAATSVDQGSPLVTVCIPHWQGGPLAKLCLRSIRAFTDAPTYEVIVVDNGSKDASLDYLRSVRWIRLIERPKETHADWPGNVASAWDLGVREAKGSYFMIMHADVFVRRAGWLARFVKALETSDRIGAAGGWKLETPHPLRAALKRATDFKALKLRLLRRLGRPAPPPPSRELYPRDYCAIYRIAPIREHGFSFLQRTATPGQEMFEQLKSAGFAAQMIPVGELMTFIHHVAHGTAGVSAEARLQRGHVQRKVERRTEDLFAQPLVRELLSDESLDT